MILKHKKIILGSLVAIVSMGATSAILVTVLKRQPSVASKDDILALANKVAQATSTQEAERVAQKFYGLEFKDVVAINGITNHDLKIQYQAAMTLGKYVALVQTSHLITVVKGKQAMTNLDQILFIFTNKTKTRVKPVASKSSKDWTINEIDKINDEFAILKTIFQGKVVKSESKLASKAPLVMMYYALKQYDLFHIFYAFKQASPTGADFSSYNAFIKGNNADGKGAFKKYLLTFKPFGSQVTSADLDGVKFTKGDPIGGKGTGQIEFAYAGLKVSKQITDFKYEPIHLLSIKPNAKSKMADEVKPEDIDIEVAKHTKDVTIASVVVSTITTDGTTVTVTYKGGKVTTQELSGFTSYQAKATSLLQSIVPSDFIVADKATMLPRAYKNKDALKNILKTKTISSISNDSAKNKVGVIFDNAKIIFKSNDTTGVLGFIVELEGANKKFTISGFKTQATFDKEVKDLANALIAAEVKVQTPPTIKLGSTTKTAADVQIGDLEISPITPWVTSVVSIVAISLTSPDGTTVTVTITVSSAVPGTTAKTYTYELSGFTSKSD